MIFMKKKENIPMDDWGLHGEFRGLDMPVCSAGDCTGLIPSLPRDEEEILSYEELYPYLPQAANSTADGNEETDSVQ